MNKLLFLLLNMLLIPGLFGQYKAYPKLEKLYNEGLYDRCIEKADEEIRENAVEIYPYIWQMRSYLAIDDLESDPLKKNALSKALNTAIRIRKKDKANTLSDVLKNDWSRLTKKMVTYISELPADQYNTGLSTYEKLKTIDNSFMLSYHQYQYMKSAGDDNAFVVLRTLVTGHYAAFKKNPATSENMEEAYADLMNEYFDHNHADYAKTVYMKALEVYPKGTICRETYLDHIADIGSRTGYYTEESVILSRMKECKTADSIFDPALVKPSLVILKKYYAIIQLRNITVQPAAVNRSVMDYLQEYPSARADSANNFFARLLRDNKLHELAIDQNRIFSQWVMALSEIKHLKQTVEVIKSIHQFNLSVKRYEQDFDFLAYCKTAYPALKANIAPLQTELEKLIVVQISNPDYIEENDEINKYAKHSDSKLIKEKQYQIYTKKLNALLTAGNYSGFSVNIYRALQQYPDDAGLLALKKQWVIADYKANCLSNSYGYDQYFTRPPDENKCDAGSVNKKGHDMVLQRINYCRRLAGSPDSCVLDEELNARCQKAAFMMTVNSALSHSPPKNWRCYTTEGAGAASASNLSLGHAFHDAIMGQMEDDGEGNTACGHRRWILNPANTVFGHGSTLNATSLYAFGSANPKLKRKLYFNEKQPVCWPAPDYFPVQLVPQRWSFSLAGVELGNAKVTMTENGKPVPVYMEPLAYGYGMNTLVWVMQGTVSADKVYTVTISNIKPYASWGEKLKENEVNKTYTYRVIPIQIR